MSNMNDIAAGLGHGVSVGIRDVAAINAMGNANEEMEMRKGLYQEKLKEIERSRNMQNEILQHVTDFETKANAFKAKQTSKIAPAQTGAIANPVNQGEPSPAMTGGDIAANPMAADSEMGLSIKDVLAVKDPKQQAAMGQNWLKQHVQSIQPSESNLDLMQLKGDLFERLETTMMKYGDVKDAMALKNARFQNLAQIATVSPKAFLNIWNTQYAGKYGGPLTEADINDKGKNIEVKMEDGRVVVVDKMKVLRGEPGGIQFANVPGEGGGSKITGHITFNEKGVPVYADKYGKPTSSKAYIKPEKGEKLTIKDVQAAHGMWLADLKERIMVDATPENKNELNNMTPEAMMSAILSGGLKSLPNEKKEAYQKEIQDGSKYFQGLSDKALGRKIGGNPRGNQPAAESKVEGKPPDLTQYPPAKHKGRTLVDDETGTKWISDGTKWHKVAG